MNRHMMKVWKGREQTAAAFERLLVLAAGDHLYRMDYQDFVRKHRQSKADITVAALPMDQARSQTMLLMTLATKQWLMLRRHAGRSISCA